MRSPSLPRNRCMWPCCGARYSTEPFSGGLRPSTRAMIGGSSPPKLALPQALAAPAHRAPLPAELGAAVDVRVGAELLDDIDLGGQARALFDGVEVLGA